MRRVVGLLVLVVAAAGLVSGCGGKSAEEKAADQRAEAAATAAAKKASQQVALRRYLAQSKIANGFYQRGRSLGSRAADSVKGKSINDPAVPAAAALYSRASQAVSEASVRQRLATPPAALKAINARFAKDMGQMADYWDELGGDLRSKDVAAYGAERTDAGDAVRNEWRLQVEAQARRLGIAMPPWTKTIGKTV